MKFKSLIYIIITIILIGIVCIYSFNQLLTPVASNGKDTIFIIESGSTLDTIAKNLQREDLIKNDIVFKIYLRANSITNFQSGKYELSSSMSAEEIAMKLQRGEVSSIDQVNITFPEGITLVEMAQLLSKEVGYPADDIIEVWNDPYFIDEAISNFSFISPKVKDKDIPYSLNGYLFPDTYYFSTKEFNPKEAAWTMLKKMENIIEDNKPQFENNDLDIHEMLTLASIIEYEANNDADRYEIAGVFNNRLKANMLLQSCATLAMATGEHKLIYSNEDMDVDSPYNTYKNLGLPIGPGNNPGEASIKATLNPNEHDYLYFLADVYGDSATYYSETLENHNKLKNKYLK